MVSNIFLSFLSYSANTATGIMLVWTTYTFLGMMMALDHFKFYFPVWMIAASFPGAVEPKMSYVLSWRKSTILQYLSFYFSSRTLFTAWLPEETPTSLYLKTSVECHTAPTINCTVGKRVKDSKNVSVGKGRFGCRKAHHFN